METSLREIVEQSGLFTKIQELDQEEVRILTKQEPYRAKITTIDKEIAGLKTSLKSLSIGDEKHISRLTGRIQELERERTFFVEKLEAQIGKDNATVEGLRRRREALEARIPYGLREIATPYIEERKQSALQKIEEATQELNDLKKELLYVFNEYNRRGPNGQPVYHMTWILESLKLKTHEQIMKEAVAKKENALSDFYPA